MLRPAQSIAIAGFGLMLMCGSLAGCRRGNATNQLTPPRGEVRVTVAEVGYDHESGSHYVRLDDRPAQRSVQIVIGDDEARAITLQLQGLAPPRPLTVDLLRTVIARTGITVDRVEVTEVRDGVYYAKVVLQGGRFAIDSRPSDAIALALGVNQPIYVAADLLQAATVVLEAAPAPLTATKFGITVEQLTPDLATYYGLATGGGVVVADFGDDAGKAGLQRGDILVEACGRAIHTPEDLAKTVLGADAPLGLTIRRGGATRTITIAPAARGAH